MIQGSGVELLEGGRARETGQWVLRSRAVHGAAGVRGGSKTEEQARGLRAEEGETTGLRAMAVNETWRSGEWAGACSLG